MSKIQIQIESSISKIPTLDSIWQVFVLRKEDETRNKFFIVFSISRQFYSNI